MRHGVGKKEEQGVGQGSGGGRGVMGEGRVGQAGATTGGGDEWEELGEGRGTLYTHYVCTYTN